jgi:hypothetical protein
LFAPPKIIFFLRISNTFLSNIFLNFYHKMIGASATLTDPARGFRADQWARYCGRHQTAEMIETTARAKLLDKSASNKWTHDSIPRSKTTSAMAQNGNIMQQQQTSHSGGKIVINIVNFAI